MSWFLNGSGLRVHNAVITSDADGAATDVFWVTNRRGRKVCCVFFSVCTLIISARPAALLPPSKKCSSTTSTNAHNPTNQPR